MSTRNWDEFYEESDYLSRYPDVAAAVDRGALRSGHDHYLTFGAREGRIGKTLGLYDEQTYLDHNLDVAAAVDRREFVSGAQHFALFGRRESRTFSPYFDETFYRRRYPDVDQAIRAGAFTSGFEHFRLFGRSPQERRSPTFLNEFDYFQGRPDVAAAVDDPMGFFSASQHYGLAGQAEGVRAPFSGTRGNDEIVSDQGNYDILTGVERGHGPDPWGWDENQLTGLYESVGANEQDTLTGGPGPDSFVVGSVEGRWRFVRHVPFYTAAGEADYAVITDFNLGQDTLVVAGQPGAPFGTIPGVDFEPDGNSVRVVARLGLSDGSGGMTERRDLVAIVLGIGSPQALQGRTTYGVVDMPIPAIAP
jgi:hypothetical protein